MKTTMLILVLLSFSINAFGQDNPIIKRGNYFIDNSVSGAEFKINSSNALLLSNDLDLIKNKNYSLTVTGIDDDIVYFKFWGFKDKNVDDKINGDNDVIYSMSIKDFKKSTSIVYNRVEWKMGVFTVPIKLRFNDFNFESNVNIGTNIGAKIRIDRRQEKGFAFEPLIGIGLSSINLNKDNSNIIDSSNLSAFSFNGGIIFHITDNVNLGAILGFDYLSGNDQKKYDWKYNGNGWLGLGINIAFSTGSENTRNPNY